MLWWLVDLAGFLTFGGAASILAHEANLWGGGPAIGLVGLLGAWIFHNVAKLLIWCLRWMTGARDALPPDSPDLYAQDVTNIMEDWRS